MKKLCLLFLSTILLFSVFVEEEQKLPRLAVVEFEINDNMNKKLINDAVSVRNNVESNIIKIGKYDVIARAEIDKLLENQKIQVSSISSKENIKKLQLQNISYLVTGTVDAMDSDYLVSIRMLDIATGKFIHSDEEFMSNSSSDVYKGVKTLVGRFVNNLTGSGDVIVSSKKNNTIKNYSGNENVSEDFVFVEGGTFLMGSTSGDNDERPVHTVTLNNFYICKHEVTQAEWKAVMGSNPSYFSGDNRPVEKVSWNAAIEYCVRRSLAEGLTPCYRGSEGNFTCDFSANGYRLPTEAEWEYAAQGGNKSYIGTKYSGSNDIDSVAWHNGNSGSVTHDVMTKLPNVLGIYDMSGNVWEWCWDWYGNYSSSDQTNPVGASSGSGRVVRGGSWYYYASNCCVANRYYDSPGNTYYYHGFRVVRSSSN